MRACKNRGMKRRCDSLVIFALLLVLVSSSRSIAASETILPEGTRITLQLNRNLSTKTNSEGDTFTAVVTTPVYVGDQIVIPKGSEVSGSISRIIRPGRFKGKAILHLLFQSIAIPGRGQAPIVATLTRVDPEGNSGIHSEGSVEGESSKGRDAGMVATPTLAGAGIGSATGGGKGAGIGAGIGAALGLAAIFSSRGKDLDLRRGSAIDILLERPLSIPSEGAEVDLRYR